MPLGKTFRLRITLTDSNESGPETKFYEVSITVKEASTTEQVDDNSGKPSSGEWMQEQKISDAQQAILY